MNIGSLFSGYGGFEMGVQSVIGGTVAWHCENDPAPSKILAHHWPDVPNLGDITAVDWAQVEPVDVIVGGSPCQDVSAAGKRAGMKAGTRSGLWASMVDAIDALRPRLVVWENVRGVTSAKADSGLEPCAGCVGNGDDGPVLRALGRVLGDLADCGYDTQWHGLRAADIGAPHGRFRVFVVATDAADIRHERSWAARNRGAGSEDRSRLAADADHSRPQGGEPAGRRHLSDRGAATDEETGESYERRLGTLRRGQRVVSDPGPGHQVVTWGQYRPAIERWEHILGRPAPAPTEPNSRGGQRLSPRFVEWMQGLPEGHVTDPAIGISRNEQLKALGNGVVPQQAAEAVSRCLAVAEVVAI